MHVSVIVPAYNEALRLTQAIRRYHLAFHTRFAEDFEILIIANGCRDNTVEVAQALANELHHIQVITIAEPVGKGGAVLEGFRHAAGQHVLFVDADGATAPDSVVNLLVGLEHHDIVIGSRRLPESHIVRRQSLLRQALSQCFGMSVRLLFGMPYQDTQCGAKAFRGDVARHLATIVTERRWAFDVDLLLWAKALDYRVVETPVIWQEQPGSRLHVIRAAQEVMFSFWRMKHRRLPQPMDNTPTLLHEVQS